MNRVALIGGIYSNYLALAAAIDDSQQRQVDGLYCLGDLGAFGPYPDRVFPLLHDHHVQCIQGNYDHSIGHGLDDCRCGYTDPRDNYFAAISYEYTQRNTSAENRRYLRELPTHHRLQLGPYRVLLCHGSPRQVNEFLWESSTSSAFLEHLCDVYAADVIVATHTGIKWHRPLTRRRHFVNAGVLGRPENDGTTRVWYTVLSLDSQEQLQVEFVPVSYDHERLACEMREEQLPEEFIATIRTGWWTTCLEVLPGKERRRGQY
jgi:predicted phosphodiesterase